MRGRIIDLTPAAARVIATTDRENSKVNRIETMKGPAESGQISSVGRRKIATQKLTPPHLENGLPHKCAIY